MPDALLIIRMAYVMEVSTLCFNGADRFWEDLQHYLPQYISFFQTSVKDRFGPIPSIAHMGFSLMTCGFGA